MRAAVPDGVPEIPGAAVPDDRLRMVPGTVRVLVADDQKVVRDGLCLLLGLLPGIEVIGTAIDGADAVRQAVATVPDIVLMDLNMPNCDGVEATRRIVRQQSYVRVVVLTAFSDDDSVFAALQAGARGFLTKNASAGEILRAISAVCAGDAQLDPSVQRRVPTREIQHRTGLPSGKSRSSPRSRRACPMWSSPTSSAYPARRSRPTLTICSPRRGRATAASWSPTRSGTV